VVYDYLCDSCNTPKTVQKKISESERAEYCPCGSQLRKLPAVFYHHGAAVENASYNPGLGQVVNNNKHAEQIAKRKGLVCIGDDSLDHIKPPKRKTIDWHDAIQEYRQTPRSDYNGKYGLKEG
jgi:hypothetical protein